MQVSLVCGERLNKVTENNMAQIDIYKAGSWHDFIPNKNFWLGTGPGVVIIPESEDKKYIAKIFTDLNICGFYTIPELIDRFLKCSGKKGLISKQVLESCLGLIIGESFTSYLKMEEYKQGYVRALSDFIFNFQRTSLKSLQSAIASFKTDHLTLKEKDLIKIYAAYEAKLPDYGYDLKSGLAEFIQNTNQENLSRYLGFQDTVPIIFFGFRHISPPEEAFIMTMFQKAKRTVFLACEDAAAPEQAVRVEKSIMLLLERFRNIAVEHQVPPLFPEHFFRTLSQGVFNTDPAPVLEDTGAPGKVHITKENNRLTEIVSIARRIKRLTEAGVSYREIRIVAPEYQMYSQIIEEVFPDYGIPFIIESGVPLARFPLATVILHMVNQSINANPYSLREKVLSSPYVGFVAEVTPADLIKYQEFIGFEFISEDAWGEYATLGTLHRLDFQFIKNLRERAYRAIKSVPGTSQLQTVREYLDGLTWEDELKKQAYLLQCLIQSYLLSLAERTLSASWRSKMSGTEFKEALLGLARRFGVEDNITFSTDNDPSSMKYKVQERDRAIFARIQILLDELVLCTEAIGKTAGEKFGLAELVRIFNRLMGEAYLPANTEAGVSVQPAGWGQYQPWHYTFICGLVDGEYPREEAFNFLHPKKDGLSLGHTYTTVDHARNHFHHLIRSTVSALFLSLPLSHNGKQLPPSPFIKEIAKRVPTEPKESEATTPDGSLVYSRREKLEFIGKNADLHYERVLHLLQEIKAEDELFHHHIREILRFDGLALNSRSFSEFDGIFHSGSSTTKELLFNELRRIVFTPAVLERYAACPLRFYFDDILGLRTGPDYHPDTYETGVLIRSVLQEYTAGVCEDQNTLENAAGLLKESVIRQVEKSFKDGGDAFQARFINGLTAGLDEKEAMRPGLFYAFLKYENETPDLLKPYLNNISGTVRCGDEMDVQVQIDRVDRTRAGDYFILFSYTVADPGNPAKILRGLRFDLPLAVLLFTNYAAERELGIPVAGAGMYLVKSPKAIKRGGYFAIEEIKASRQNHVSDQQPVFSGQREGFMERDRFLRALEAVKDHAARLYNLMKRGVFHLPLCDEADQTCANCSFARICRKDQPRLDRIWANVRDDEDINVIRGII